MPALEAGPSGAADRSGAGHDVQCISSYPAPTGMILIPGKDGISHNGNWSMPRRSTRCRRRQRPLQVMLQHARVAVDGRPPGDASSRRSSCYSPGKAVTPPRPGTADDGRSITARAPAPTRWRPNSREPTTHSTTPSVTATHQGASNVFLATAPPTGQARRTAAIVELADGGDPARGQPFVPEDETDQHAERRHVAERPPRRRPIWACQDAG